MNSKSLNPHRYLKYVFLFIAAGTLVLFFESYFFNRAGVGQTLVNASYEEKGRSVASAFLEALSKKPFEKIKSIRLTYDLHMECAWMIDLRMNIILEMKKKKKGFIATYKLTEPVGENLWGKFALFFFGRFTEAYKKLVKAIKGGAIETFHFKNGKFATNELIGIFPPNKKGKAGKGFRIFFDYDQKVIKFWKKSSQKKPTAWVKYENQVGPLTAYFTFLLFTEHQTEIRLINKLLRAKHDTASGKRNFREWKGDFLFASQTIGFRPNNTGKHREYANVLYLGKDAFFDIVYGKYVYFNFLSMAGRKGKTPYSCYVAGIIDIGKKKKKAKRLKMLKKKAKNRKSFEKQLKAIEGMNILAAWNVRVHMTEGDVIFH